MQGNYYINQFRLDSDKLSYLFNMFNIYYYYLKNLLYSYKIMYKGTLSQSDRANKLLD